MPVRRKRCTLRGRDVQSLDRFYGDLARGLSFPAHFGRNLDALWDALVHDVPGPLEVVWRDAAASRAAMGKDFERVVDVLREVERARNDFRLRLLDTDDRA